ncbi:MAG: DUF92 domain-containing protein [Candidatus Pristimantibacillus lignocellulolyticus]|uniref:DUF92 domain-containing protein n=1 Tax=Candidatus Pristimantibacillus lignocellulolyticus TaxID=2994561 RepID=A0A9J6ZEE2_9BACL|nr:MAG: DUF92 domain-containing protein [Candidatus Pristimantibacillus lignocellulolyticus]
MVTIVSEWWIRLILGAIGSGLIGYSAYRKQSLSFSGMLSAMIMGTGFVLFGEPIWFSLLIVFFVSSTFWSKWKRSVAKKREVEGNYEKSGRRDAGQVWANGGIGLLLCIGHALMPHEGWLYAYIGVMASVTADTWATEIGALSKSEPISVITWKRVSSGTSGGISWLGSLASLAGATLIGLVSSLFMQLDYRYIVAGAIAGFVGAMIDSVIGARLQVMYRCENCGKIIERKTHCGTMTKYWRGLSWMNNDRVNGISSVIGGAVALGLMLIMI